jgi:hypothetical protein
MVEPPAQSSGPDTNGEAKPTGRIPYRTAVLVILPVAFLGAATSACSFVLQTRGGNTASGVTMLVALITLADAAGSAVAMRLPAAHLRAQVLLAAVGAILAAVASASPSALVPSALALAFAAGVSHPLRAAAIQRLASDDVRARAASVASACDMAFSTIVLLITGTLLARR